MRRELLRILCALASALIAVSCSEDQFPENEVASHSNAPQSEVQESVRLTVQKASAIAGLFSPFRGVSENVDGDLNKTAEVAPKVSNISYYIDNGDTLLFAFNYGESNGYTIIGANASSFPVLAQSEQGSVDFDEIEAGSSFEYFVNLMAESVKGSSLGTDTAYASLWSGVDDEEWEYSVEVVDPCFEADSVSCNKSRSRISSGKEAIYPYTGLALKEWRQEGDYNYYAVSKKVCIGCPAMAVGMLLFDVNNRIDGVNVKTNPFFSCFDQYPAYAKSVSKKLRCVADAIPNYKWGTEAKPSSGISNPSDLVNGLKKLGFSKAKLSSFDFEKAYAAMCIEGTDYFGKPTTFHRGIIMLGQSGAGGHVWFCDGYYEQQYQVTKRRKRLFHSTSVTKWTEYENRFYMNWGQIGGNNGWFIVENGNGMNISYRYALQMITGLDYYSK